VETALAGFTGMANVSAVASIPNAMTIIQVSERLYVNADNISRIHFNDEGTVATIWTVGMGDESTGIVVENAYIGKLTDVINSNLKPQRASS
jgi:hypothetical protein